MSHFNFWHKVLLTTHSLWLQSQDHVLLREKQTPSIIKFFEENMTVRLIVISWESPLKVLMNDVAEPIEDLPKLFDYIQTQIPSWENQPLYKDYVNFLVTMLEDYMNVEKYN